MREAVATEFDALLHDGQAAATNGMCRTCGRCRSRWTAKPSSSTCRPRWPSAVRQWSAQPRIQGLRDDSKLRLAKLINRAAHAVQDGRCTMEAAVRFVDWLEPLLRRESYLALLVERPEVENRLLRLLGLARWPMRYLMLHPGVIDELADERLLHSRFDRDEYIFDLDARHQAWERSGQADEESLLDTLRRAHHAEVFRTLVRDVEGHITVEEVADDLSALADATLECTLRWAWRHLKLRHRDDPRFAVIAYGKLGGKELGYGSDLDVVFLYDDEDERSPEVYGAFVRKLINWLTLRTAAGELFDIDTALRPNGNSGLLVASLQSYERYQTGRGSNTAWTWGAPGAHPRTLLRGPRRHRPALRGRASRGARRAARCRCVARRSAGDAREGARRTACAQRALRRQAQRRGHDGRGVRGPVPRARAQCRASAAAGQQGQHRAVAARRSGRAAAAWRRRGGRRRVPRAAPRPAPRTARRAADAGCTRDARAAARRGLALWRAVFG
jgi:hypothetical protein